MKTPTKKQITANIAWLTKNISQLPMANAFGENIQNSAKAALEVLVKNLSRDAIDDRSHFEDESEEQAEDESKDWNPSQRDAAVFARDWLDGEEECSPMANYKGLVGKTFKPIMRPPTT